MIELSATVTARMYFRDGGDLGSNPYPKDSPFYDEFMMEMARLQYQEFKQEQAELRAGV